MAARTPDEINGTRREWLAEPFVQALRRLPLPQEFESYAAATAFRAVRGGPRRISLHRRDGIYHAVESGKPCGCEHEKVVR